MKQRPRIYYTETDKALMWQRWQKGDSLHAMAGSDYVATPINYESVIRFTVIGVN